MHNARGAKIWKTASRPYVTAGLIVSNVVVFLAEQGQFTVSGSTVHGKVVNEGVIYRAAIADGHQYWRLLTNAFLHENLLHIFFNMYLLYLLGNMLEPAIGSVKFAAIYCASLFAASFGVLLWSDAASLGASGAIFGVMSATAVELRARGHPLRETGIGALIVINLVFSFLVPDISIGAHIGGLIGGTLAGLALRMADDHRMPMVGLIACIALAAASVTGSLVDANTNEVGPSRLDERSSSMEEVSFTEGPVSCPPGGSQCLVAMVVQSEPSHDLPKPTVIASRTLNLAAGKTTEVELTLSPMASRLVDQGRVLNALVTTTVHVGKQTPYRHAKSVEIRAR